MENRTRRLLVATIAIAVILVYAGYAGWRLLHFHRTGVAGLNYLPPLPPMKGRTETPQREVSKPKAGFLGRLGSIVMIFPGSPAERAGLRVGDRVNAVNGIPTTDQQAIRELGNRLRAGERVTYSIERKDKPLQISLALESPLRWRLIQLSIITGSLLALAFLASGLIVHWKKPDDRRALVYFMMTVVAAGSYIAGPVVGLQSGQVHGFGSEPFAGGVAGITLLTPLALLLPSLLLHFALIFPRQRPLIAAHPRLIRVVYTFPLLAILIMMVPSLGMASIGFTVAARRSLHFSPWWLIGSVLIVTVSLAAWTATSWWKTKRLLGWKEALLTHPFKFFLAFVLSCFLILMLLLALNFARVLPMWPAMAVSIVLMMLFAACLLAYPILTCVVLFRNYKDSGVEEKRQVRWPLWGMLTAIGGQLLGSLLVSIPVLLAVFRGQDPFDIRFIWYGDVLKLLYLLIPISFSFAILKYRLMDIDVLIKKTVTYTILSVLIGLAYLGLVGGIGTLLVKFAGIESQAVTIVSTLAIAAVVVPLRNKVQSLVDRNLYRKKIDYPQALRALSEQVLQSTDVERMLQRAAEGVQQACQVRAVVIFVRGEVERRFRAVAKVGLPDEILDRTAIEPGEKLFHITEVIDVRVEDFSEIERAKLQKIRAQIVVPLKVKAQLMGLMTVGSALSDRDLDTDDRDFLMSAGAQIAVGIDNLLLHQEEREVGKAREIQESLLPRQIAQIENCEIVGTWQPAKSVGGDYYDVLKLGDQQVAICIGDVSGKGLPAALLMSNLQAAVRVISSDKHRPSELCAKLNRVLSTNLAPGRFITFFYSLLNGAQKTISYTNAGHNPPILLLPDGSVRRLDAGGAVVARLFSNSRYEEGQVEWRGGERMVLFTDGVTEARNADNEEFGEERLLALLTVNVRLSASELQTKVLDAVQVFTAGNLQDDVTLVVVAFADPA